MRTAASTTAEKMVKTMYSMEKDAYTCDACGLELKWDASDDRRGTMWECERCGAHFGTGCFVEKLGRERFDKMMKESDLVLCTECYKKGERSDD